MNSKSLRTSVGILALALVCAAGAQSLDGINAKKVGKGLQVQIVGQDLHKPVASWNNTRNTYQLTFDGKLNGPAKTVRVDSNGVSAVQYSWISRKSGKVRVSMYLGKAAKPELVQMDGLWAVNFNVEDKKTAPVANTPKDEFTLPPIQEPKKAAPQKQANNLVSNFTSNMMVDLDFVNTDIVQILKALALQANVNIVTSPDVAGRITVTLDSVSVKDALDIVTALGGVRYAKVGNTFVVTSNSRFSDTIQQIGGRIDVSSETRVVPLFSGEGTQIKAAVLQTISPSTITGRYDLVLPSDKVQVASKSTTAPVDANAGDKGAGAAQGSEISTTSDTTLTGAKRDDYMVVVGTPGRLDEVEKMIRSVDQQICSALGIKTNGGTGIIQRTYEPKGISAEELYAVIKSDKSLDFGNVKILATPKNSMSKQAVVLSGRAADVENLMTILENLDSQPQGGATFYEVVDLKFIKPQVAAVELMGSVAGLKAAILPPPVDPLQGIEYTHDATFAAGAADRMNGQNGNNGGNGGNGGAGGAGGGDEGNSGGNGGGGGSEKNDRATMAGRKADKTTQFMAEVRTNRTPMKVLLRGTRDQIDRARAFLAMVDIAPKQVAVEVRVMELSRDDALKIGLDWSLLTGGTLSALRVNQGIGSDALAGGVGANLGFKGGGLASVTGTLDSIANKNNLLARPNILLTDGVVSNIFVGDTVRYVKAVNTSQNGTTIITDEINVGVDFSLAARVGSDGNIALDFNPVLSILQGFVDTVGGGKLPQTSVRSANSSVQIKSGETIAIGGLIQDQDRKSYGGIPILKDLPIIGQLFGRTSNSRVRSEVVFFVTVKEVDPNNRGGAANPRQSVRENTATPGDKGG
jgi:type II secretory pathway component GspD/PulD (secretin)